MHSSPARTCEEAFAASYKLPPVASDLREDLTGTLSLIRLEAEGDAFAYALSGI